MGVGLAFTAPELFRLHAKDYELITPAGHVFTRSEYLSAIEAEPFYTGWELGPIGVQVGENVTVLRYRAVLQFPSGRKVSVWHTDVYRRSGTTWLAVWSQATEIKASAG